MSGKEQLQLLERYYNKEGSQLLVVYGQKNIGMEQQLRDFCTGKPCHYYHARACSEREQLYLWGKELQESGAVLPEYPDFTQIFQAICEADSAKKVIVIEDFHNIIKQSDDFMPWLVRFMKDEKKPQDVLIIFTSTAIGWIENSMVARIGSAAYLISGFVKMKEQGFAECKQYFSRNTKEQQIEIYAVLGGYIQLWKQFENGLSIKENICRHVLPKESYLHEEALRIVAGELREPGVYHTILCALAAGRQKLNDLHLHTGFSRAKISVYLKNLMELELVEKVFSYDTAGREHSQKGIYRISNPFVAFYFRFIYPNMSALAYMEPEAFYEAYIQNAFAGFVETAFKKICTEALVEMNERQALPVPGIKIGEWIGKIGDIDIITQTEDGKITIALCNWEKEKIMFEDYEWFLFCADKAKISADYICLFSARGFDEKIILEAEERGIIKLYTAEIL